MTSLLEQIFKPVGSKIPGINNLNKNYGNPFKKGNLITFNYAFWKHDPQPLVVISPPPKNPVVTFGIGHLWGINLHLLTFFEIKKLLTSSKNPSFSYLNYVKLNTQLKNAYRSYKWSGVKQVKTINYEFFVNIINTVRNQDPAETEIIRKNVQEQINKQINPKSYEVNLKTLNKEENTITQVPIIKTVPTVQNKNQPE